MPQLDFTFYPSQIFWLAISFLLLYLIFARFVLPRLARVQTQRAKATSGKRQQAQIAVERAEKALTLYEDGVARAKAEAQKVAGREQQRTDKLLAQKSEEARRHIHDRIQRAEREIQGFLLDHERIKIDAAALIARHIVKELADIELSEEDVQNAVQKIAFKNKPKM